MVSESPELKKSLIATLQEEIASLGTYYEMRRRSAFAGLLQLGEYTACVKAISEESSPSLNFLLDYHDIDVVVCRMFFEHWDKLQEALAAQSKTIEIPWGALIFNGLAREALPNTEARAQLISYIKAMKPKDWSESSLALMFELLPKSSELRACLIECISKLPAYRDLSFEAVKIYAEQYGGEEQSLLELQKYINGSDRSPMLPKINHLFVYALALGWPNSPLLRPYLEQTEIPKDFPLLTAIALCGITGNESYALACIDTLVQLTIENGRALSDIFWKSLRYWASTSCAEPLLRRLMVDDSVPSRKINAMRLLDDAGKLTNDDRIALMRQFDELLGETAKTCPDGVELVNGTVTTLPQAIYRLLVSEGSFI
jgi:hypothetical protein